MGKVHWDTQEKRELALDIMANAIEKVRRLGFVMKVGNPSGGKAGLTAIDVAMGGMNLSFYFIGTKNEEPSSSDLGTVADRVRKSADIPPSPNAPKVTSVFTQDGKIPAPTHRCKIGSS